MAPGLNRALREDLIKSAIEKLKQKGNETGNIELITQKNEKKVIKPVNRPGTEHEFLESSSLKI